MATSAAAKKAAVTRAAKKAGKQVTDAIEEFQKNNSKLTFIEKQTLPEVVVTTIMVVSPRRSIDEVQSVIDSQCGSHSIVIVGQKYVKETFQEATRIVKESEIAYGDRITTEDES